MTKLLERGVILDAVVQVISQLGFPIAVACAFFWYMVKEQRELRAVIDNNSNILLRILEHMKSEEKGRETDG